jgi:ubiquinone/menaquinone biosynthesis C-methylase UbiE
VPRRPRYEQGGRPSWHAELIERAADVAVAALPVPLRVLDVGCGEGELLEALVIRVPYAESYVGLDPLPGVLATARERVDPRIRLVRGAAEALPFADRSFDLVLVTMSFGYWSDQRASVRELSRVVADTGAVVLIESVTGDKRGVRGRAQIGALLAEAGLELVRTEVVRRSVLRRPSVCAFIASP